ncbi:MAG: Gfo/Idh/MocA family oxidoreductase [Clostridia bacterium]|nr:Gfo/Idh/MocA family oxidoreductase [Clostridia bacterium]MBR6787389.1 Gfo/Idh/MocA family oxidoreductase [Clostridia bacterium]
MARDILNEFETIHDEEKAIDTGKKVKIGIIGCGWIAGAHIIEYLKMEDVEVVALADLIPGKAEAFAKKYGVEGAKYYLSGHDMLENEQLDGVSICTYNTQHAPCAIDALEHGVNVMLEKPFTVTLDEAIEVMKAEKKSGKILTIGFQPRMSANIQMIKKIIDSGELGKVYYMQAGGGRRRGIPTPYGTTFIEKETGGIGAMGDIGCYSLDMLLNAVGYPKPLTVSGYTANFFGVDPENYPGHPEYAEKFGVEDFAAGFIRLEGGIILDFRISWAMNMDSCGDTLILGTKGGLRIPSMDCYNGDLPKPMMIYKNVAGKKISFEVPKDEAPDLFFKKLRSFVDAIKTNGKATVSSKEIVINQAIIDAIIRSNEAGREIEVVIPEV